MTSTVTVRIIPHASIAPIAAGRRNPSPHMVTFKLRTANDAEWTDERSTRNSVPLDRIADALRDKNIRSADQVAIPRRIVRLRYAYPLIKPRRFEHNASYGDGFTRHELLELVYADYAKIRGIEQAYIRKHPTALSFNVRRGHTLDDLAVDHLMAVGGSMYQVSMVGEE